MIRGESEGEALVISRGKTCLIRVSPFFLCIPYFVLFFLFFLKQSIATCQFFIGAKTHAFPSLKALKCHPQQDYR